MGPQVVHSTSTPFTNISSRVYTPESTITSTSNPINTKQSPFIGNINKIQPPGLNMHRDYEKKSTIGRIGSTDTHNSQLGTDTPSQKYAKYLRAYTLHRNKCIEIIRDAFQDIRAMLHERKTHRNITTSTRTSHNALSETDPQHAVITEIEQIIDAHTGQNNSNLNRTRNTIDTSLGGCQPSNTRWGTTEDTTEPELQNLSRHATRQPNHAQTYAKITLNTEISLNSGNTSVGSKYSTQRKYITEIMTNRGANRLRQSQTRPADNQHMGICTHTCNRTSTRCIPERGENIHSKTQTPYTHAQEKRTMKKLNGQPKLGTTTIATQTQTQLKYTTGITKKHTIHKKHITTNANSVKAEQQVTGIKKWRYLPLSEQRVMPPDAQNTLECTSLPWNFSPFNLVRKTRSDPERNAQNASNKPPRQTLRLFSQSNFAITSIRNSANATKPISATKATPPTNQNPPSLLKPISTETDNNSANKNPATNQPAMSSLSRLNSDTEAPKSPCRFDGVTVVPAQFIGPKAVRCISLALGRVQLQSVEVSTNGVDFTTDGHLFSYQSAPSVHSLAPLLGPPRGQTRVHVYGTNFKAASYLSCLFGRVVAVPAMWISTEELICGAPSVSRILSLSLPMLLHPDSHGSISVTHDVTNHQLHTSVDQASISGINVDDRAQYSAEGVKFVYHTPVLLTNLHPISGSVIGGTKIIVYGQNFLDAPHLGCKFGNIGVVPATYVSPTSVLCISPRLRPNETTEVHSTMVPVYVTLNGKDFTSRPQFSYRRGAKVLAVMPIRGPQDGGTPVHVVGANFHDSKQLYCCLGNGTAPVLARFLNSNESECTSPPGPGLYQGDRVERKPNFQTPSPHNPLPPDSYLHNNATKLHAVIF